MDHQFDSFFKFPSSDSKPLFLTFDDMSWVPRSPEMVSMPRGGADMEWNGSSQSNSTISSNESWFSSASTNSMEADESFPRYEYSSSTRDQYRDLDRTTTLPQQRADAPSRIAPFTSNPTHATPSSLGWTTDTQLWKLYKFIVPKGKEPYMELLPPWTVTEQTPSRVFLDPVGKQISGRGTLTRAYPCQFPGGCPRDSSEPFNRPADLERHYKIIHAELDEAECFFCDYYPRCQRSKDPFTRKDHFRDHLREFHKEDLGCAKGEKIVRDRKKWSAKQKQWMQERQISPRWWRCPRCLVRIHVADEGWDCPKCKAPCEQDRKEARGWVAEAEPESASPLPVASTSFCSVCVGALWYKDMAGNLAPCPTCQFPATSSVYSATPGREWQ